MLGRKNRNEADLGALVNLFTESLPAENIADARDLIDHGEYGVALELVCTQLYEYDVPVPTETYRLIEQCGRIMQMNEASWAFLEELRTP